MVVHSLFVKFNSNLWINFKIKNLCFYGIFLFRGRQGSLVQRELSAKLTEGLFYSNINPFADAAKISGDFIVWNSYHGQSVIFEKGSSFIVLSYIIVFVVL